jgi:hypothetical protein
LELLAYLWDRPGSEDTLVGIGRWWTLRQQIHAMIREVARGLDELVEAGLVVSAAGADGHVRYRMNRKMRRKIALLLANAHAVTAKPIDGTKKQS